MTVAAEPVSNVARGIATSMASQLVARVLHVSLNIVSSLAIIHYLSPGTYGDYVLALGVTTMFGLFADFGLPKLAVREISRDRSCEGEIIGTVMMLRLVLTVAAFAFTQVTLFILGSSAQVHVVALVLSTLVLSESLLTVIVAFHVRLEQHYEAFVRVFTEALETSAVLLLVFNHATLLQVVAAPAVASIITFVLAAVIARRRYRLAISVAVRLLPKLLTEALPIGPALLAGVLWLKLCSVLLAAVRSQQEVGFYGAAFQPVEYLFLASAVLINVLFPVLATAHGHDPARFHNTYSYGSQGLLVAVLPVSILLIGLAQPLVNAAYGADFAAAAGPMRLLAVALVFMVFSTWLGFVLLSAGRQRVTLVYDLAAVPTAVVAGLLLMPRYGALGAAMTAAITSGGVVVAALYATRKLLGLRIGSARVARAVGANAALAIALWGFLALGTPWWAALIGAGLSYPVWLIVFGVVRLEQVRGSVRLLGPVPAGVRGG